MIAISRGLKSNSASPKLYHISVMKAIRREYSQFELSLVPAPPSGYIQRSSGIPSSLAYSVEVKIHAPAKFTLLNAFIKRGSGSVRMIQQFRIRHTWKAYHPIFLRNRSNHLFSGSRLAIIPCQRVPLRDFRKIGVQLSRLVIIIHYRLSTMRSKCILIQWVYMNRQSYRMKATKIYKGK